MDQVEASLSVVNHLKKNEFLEDLLDCEMVAGPRHHHKIS